MTLRSDYARGARAAAAGLLINSGLSVVKLAAGLIGNSFALVADAIESLADSVASLVVLRGMQVAAKPPDHEHPYGHGKAEPLAALTVSLLVAIAGIGIAIEAIRNILTPHAMPAWWTLLVLLVVVAVKEALYWRTRRTAGEIDSSAVRSDAWHHRSDAITSAAAGIGILVALMLGPGHEAADDWAALLASGIVLWNAFRLHRAPLGELMDANPAALIEHVRLVADGVAGVEAVEKVHARKSGLRYYVDMHVEVDPEMNVRRAHEVAHAVKDAIQAAEPRVGDVLVHVEPAGQARRPDPANQAPVHKD